MASYWRNVQQNQDSQQDIGLRVKIAGVNRSEVFLGTYGVGLGHLKKIKIFR